MTNNINKRMMKLPLSTSIWIRSNLLLLLLLYYAKLLSDGGTVLAFVTIENLLNLKDTLTPEFILTSLFGGLLGARAHELGGSVRELWYAKRLSLWRLLLLDLVIIDRLQVGVLSLRPIYVLWLAVVNILIIHLHLVRIVTSHRSIHLNLIYIIYNLSALSLHPRLSQSRD